ncbi:hypothetical protein SteCoe_16066 [Stentor coeruleus]|uniref:Uncharacterized protein n=1 Tax=Stentor coeruleus TaxID=5963 RepID=A0A1R2C2B1_9CILI|nr:hypothetical protein SteCoe_16066 [Stentor coeruleus]
MSEALSKTLFSSPILPEITHQQVFSSPGHFNLTCFVGITQVLVRYSMQVSKKVFTQINQVFEETKEIVEFYASHYNLKDKVHIFYQIIPQLVNVQYAIGQRLGWIDYYTGMTQENYRVALEDGMKLLISAIFQGNNDMIASIMHNDESQKIAQILTEVSKRFKVKFVALINGEKKEYLGVEEDVPIVYIRYDGKESAILYTNEMMNIGNLDPGSLEELPFMYKRLGNATHSSGQAPDLRQGLAMNPGPNFPQNPNNNQNKGPQSQGPIMNAGKLPNSGTMSSQGPNLNPATRPGQGPTPNLKLVEKTGSGSRQESFHNQNPNPNQGISALNQGKIPNPANNQHQGPIPGRPFSNPGSNPSQGPIPGQPFPSPGSNPNQGPIPGRPFQNPGSMPGQGPIPGQPFPNPGLTPNQGPISGKPFPNQGPIPGQPFPNPGLTPNQGPIPGKPFPNQGPIPGQPFPNPGLTSNQGPIPGKPFPNQGPIPGQPFPNPGLTSNQGPIPGKPFPNQGPIPGQPFPNPGLTSNQGPIPGKPFPNQGPIPGQPFPNPGLTSNQGPIPGKPFPNQGPIPGQPFPNPGLTSNQGPIPGKPFPNQGPIPGQPFPNPGLTSNQGPIPGQSFPNPGLTSNQGPIPGKPFPNQGPIPGQPFPNPGLTPNQGPIPGQPFPNPVSIPSQGPIPGQPFQANNPIPNQSFPANPIPGPNQDPQVLKFTPELQNQPKLAMPDDIVELIKIMAEILYEKKEYNENLINHITKLNSKYSELKAIKFLDDLTKITAAESLTSAFPKKNQDNNYGNPSNSLQHLNPPQNLNPQQHFNPPQNLNPPQHYNPPQNFNPPQNLNPPQRSHSPVQNKPQVKLIKCDYDNAMVNELDFSDLICADQCKICTKCRIQNTEQCVRCQGFYSNNQKDLLEILKMTI